MAISLLISHFTLPPLYLFLLLFSSSATPISAVNITTLLSSYPDLSDFTNLLLSTAVASDLSNRYSLTLLVVPNSFLHQPSSTAATNIADVLRYHVLLEYISWPDLTQIPPAGRLITTLYQTTGRASGNFGSVNLTRDLNTDTVSVRTLAEFSGASNATLLHPIKTLPYNVSIFAVNALIVPSGFDLMASDARPTLSLNITKSLLDGHNFNVAASMLAASGVVEEFEKDEGGAGITLFVPTDDAFSDLPPTARFQSLPADKKADVLRFHVLHSYYPLGSLESIVNPVQPTLATEKEGAGSFTLNISRVNGSMEINTGIIQASVTQTVSDQNPVAIFGVSRVLLPREIFGKNPIGSPSGSAMAGAQPPDVAMSPQNAPGLDGPSSHLSSPPGFREEFTSEAANYGVRIANFALFFCIVLLYALQ